MHTERFFFPTKGRLERKVARRAQAGLALCATVSWPSFWGPFCVFLVFQKA